MIRILKMEILLEELQNIYPAMLPTVENQIETLLEELILVRTFLMVEENEEMKSTHIRAVLGDVAATFYSHQWNFLNEDTGRKLSLLLPALLEKVKLVSTHTKQMYMCVRSSLPSYFRKTDGFGFMEFLLRDLKELLNSNEVSINKVKHQIRVVHRDMESLRSFLRGMGDKHHEDSDLKSLVSHIVDVALQVEYITDSFVCGHGVRWYHVVWLSDLIEDIKLIKIQAFEISKTYEISIPDVQQSTRKVMSLVKMSLISDVVVDLVDENERMIDRLTRGSLQRDVVSVVGMAGIGKTTLALKVNNCPSITYHFHVCAWCHVSEVFSKRELLLEILGDMVEITDKILEMSDEDLEIKLYRWLKGKRYIIVMDDMWSIEAWNDLERSFPDDQNGSRVLISSRLHEVALKIKASSIPHSLRLLSIDESWELLQRKLFKSNDCPDELLYLGKQIAQSCKGLPLALVAISGILQRTVIKPEWWKEVAESLSSLIADDPETRCMDILALSY
ncbi:OLC1v1032665C1 [Oldenlandia corymbosa var. corymbosa]|uniref:OLC1v1032665C1 n=1 Tax=Oldenlandia corymbosa var. corymbosa TaxID=529605 RepID=A0AAV1CN48_OLDCO|nr:OLC1v1032665C1 [Oldenlandia corymbosa var. corymbosa]